MRRLIAVALFLTTAAAASGAMAQMAHAPVPSADTIKAAKEIGMDPSLLEKLRILKPPRQIASSYLRSNQEVSIVTSTGKTIPLIPGSLMTDSPLSQKSAEPVPQVAKYMKHINRPTLQLKTAEVEALDPTAPPEHIDHRSKQSAIRWQGGRNTCVAHAVAAALEATPNVDTDLSEEYLFHEFMLDEHNDCCSGPGLRTIDAADYLAHIDIPDESFWKYDQDPPNCGSSDSCALPHHEVPNHLDQARRWKVTSTEIITDNGVTGASIRNPAYLEALIASGYDVVFGTFVAWDDSKAKQVLDVVIDPDTNKPFETNAGHAMLICGYNRNGGYFIAKNSWDKDWGHDGYAYLSYDYVRTYAKYGFIITGIQPQP
jgi:C1A family cysteine protease